MNFLLTLLLFAQQAFVSPDDVFRAAEDLYREGRYSEAAERYEALIGQGVHDGTLSYNLGNGLNWRFHAERTINQKEKIDKFTSDLQVGQCLLLLICSFCSVCLRLGRYPGACKPDVGRFYSFSVLPENERAEYLPSLWGPIAIIAFHFTVSSKLIQKAITLFAGSQVEIS